MIRLALILAAASLVACNSSEATDDPEPAPEQEQESSDDDGSAEPAAEPAADESAAEEPDDEPAAEDPALEARRNHPDYGTRGGGGEIAVPDMSSPAAPAEWVVFEDFLVTPEDLDNFSEFLGARVVSARNTIFTVGEGNVQINSVRFATEGDCEIATTRLLEVEEPGNVLQRGDTFYQFMADPSMAASVAAGRAMLESL